MSEKQILNEIERGFASDYDGISKLIELAQSCIFDSGELGIMGCMVAKLNRYLDATLSDILDTSTKYANGQTDMEKYNMALEKLILIEDNYGKTLRSKVCHNMVKHTFYEDKAHGMRMTFQDMMLLLPVDFRGEFIRKARNIVLNMANHKFK